MTLSSASNTSDELSQTLIGICNLYSHNLATYGPTSKSVGWKDEASQHLRFQKLLQVITKPTPAEGLSINDLGCGYGAMFSYMTAQPGLSLARYYGYDISQTMLTTAAEQIADPRATWLPSAQITTEADYSFVSGTFNVRLEANDQLWFDYIKETLLSLAEKSRRGLAFNLLTTYVDWKQDNLYYADPFILFDFCKQNISRYVSLLHDYPLYEWTMLVRMAG